MVAHRSTHRHKKLYHSNIRSGSHADLQLRAAPAFFSWAAMPLKISHRLMLYL